MPIDPIGFGKNLRPSTIDLLNKVNEIITAVNSLDPTGIGELQSDVTQLQSEMTSVQGSVSTLQSQMSTANSNISTLQESTNANTSDINDIKVTLYTPLESTENQEG